MNQPLSIFIAFGLLSAPLFADSLSAPVQHGSINLGGTLSLKNIFDGGLRPYIVVEKDSCSVGEAIVTLIREQHAGLLALHVQRIEFNVTRHETITWMTLRCMTVSVPDAEKVIKEAMDFFATAPAGLEEAIAQITPLNPKWSKVWTQDLQCDGFDVRLSLNPQSYYSDDPASGYRNMRADVVFSFVWREKEIGPTFRKKKIVPPQGYEHISMEIPTTDLLRKIQGSVDPSYSHLQINSPSAVSKQPSLLPADTGAIVVNHPAPERPSNPPAHESRGNNLVWWIVGSIIIFGSAVFVAYKKSRENEPTGQPTQAQGLMKSDDSPIYP